MQQEVGARAGRIIREAWPVELFDVRDRARLAEALRVRVAVFVEEQRVPADEEVDEHDRDDPSAVHALVRPGDGPAIAAGRFYVRTDRSDRCVRIGRMAVLREERGRGAGRALLDALLAEARRRGYRHATLNAQTHAVEFYRRAGFRPRGETVLEAGILHQPMERPLRAASARREPAR